MRTRIAASAVPAISVLAVVSAISCGQKGPPLPPIVRTPVAPVVTADRRGNEIQLGLTVPAANTDGSRPANIARVDIYAVNGAAPSMTDAEILRKGTKVASLAVKTPRDPNEVAEKEESAENVEPPTGEGLEQGASSTVAETITAGVLESKVSGDVPLLGPPAATALRTYVGVGVDRHGHRGQFSKRVAVPLQLPPSPPPPIGIQVEEKKIIITWTPRVNGTENVLESHSFGPLLPEVGYNLYDGTTGQKLNPQPVKENGYEDTRMDWGTTRCYIVRAVEVVARLPLESEATGPECTMLVDTFPPAQPRGLKSVTTAGAINLIWEANTEPDLAGYHVLRAEGPSWEFARLTKMPVAETTFFDTVKPGVRYLYKVEAVDKAGNVSKASDQIEETAR